MVVVRLWAGVAIAFAACSFSGTSPDGVADLPDAAEEPCTEAENQCVGPNTLSACRDDGSGLDALDCPAGCIEDPDPHCGSFEPSNGIELEGAPGDVDTTGGDWIFFTDTGEITDGSGGTIRAAGAGIDADTGIGFTALTQADGPDIGVFEMASLRIAAGTRIRGRGEGSLAVAVSGPVHIAGVLDVVGGADACFSGGPGSGRRCGGPGAFVGGQAMEPGSGDQGGGAGDNDEGESGGGGGGHGGAGGDGGDGGDSDGGGGGGVSAVESPIPLVGGSGGGGGGTETEDDCLGVPPPFPGGVGGGGGGAVQLVSLHSVIFEAGASCGINGGGGGGAGGQCNAGGGGGGAGGAILVEAPVIELASGCVLAVNGGGGGGASNPFGPGEEGQLDTGRADGGDGIGGSDGGDGGAIDEARGARSGEDVAGGGGGGAGRILLRSVAGQRTLSGDVSPPPETSELDIE